MQGRDWIVEGVMKRKNLASDTGKPESRARGGSSGAGGGKMGNSVGWGGGGEGGGPGKENASGAAAQPWHGDLEKFIRLGEEAKAAEARGDIAQASSLFKKAIQCATEIQDKLPGQKQQGVAEAVARFREKLKELKSAPGPSVQTRAAAAGGAGRGGFRSMPSHPPPVGGRAGAVAGFASAGPWQQPSNGRAGGHRVGIGALDETERKMVESSMEKTPNASWDDVGGLEDAKRALRETVVYPLLNPSVFSGMRAPPKGILLFGPPGNGKTFLAKVVASECRAAFFSISASSLTSKWHGEGEKQVKSLFSAARKLQPAVIFVDEIDSVLSMRSANENDATRRLKTEFLVAFDGLGSCDEDRILVLAATNRPMDLDDAVIRRFPKRIFIPLPDAGSRVVILKRLMGKTRHSLSDRDLEAVARVTDSYSASDLAALCREGAMGPVRDFKSPIEIAQLKDEELRPVSREDVLKATGVVRPSASRELQQELEQWNAKFGSH